ncbi:MAG: hypothetical protein WC829_20270 [Hyphomicrobium sp.]|jgi:hypothetical protein
MQIDPVGIALMAILLLVGALFRAPISVALFAAMPFGATAVAALTALGGASLMLFTPLTGLLIAYAMLRKTAVADLRTVYSDHWSASLITLLVVYVVAGAVILPRLFAGDTTVFVPGVDKVIEVPLMPVPGNINQSGYFVADALAFFAFSILLLRTSYFSVLKTALLAFAVVHASLCLIDLAGKLAGAGDVLAFLRTSGYSMLTEVQAEGFWRIVGAYPEASICSAATATAFAFTFSYWRATGSRPTLALTAVLGMLLVLSTSTTGYVVLAALILAFLFGVLARTANQRLESRDLWVVTIAIIGGVAMFALVLSNDSALNSFARLLEGSIVEKASSSSAAERFYWNYKSLMAFVDTGGLGVGLGSSRASSWMIAVLSQLGAFGAIALGLLTWQVLRPVSTGSPPAEYAEIAAICQGIRSATFASLVAMLISGGNADPGVLFFMALAALIAGRKLLDRRQVPAMRASPYWDIDAGASLSPAR